MIKPLSIVTTKSKSFICFKITISVIIDGYYFTSVMPTDSYDKEI